MQNTIPERRTYKRFKLKDPVFAMLNYSANRMGKIIDISKSGLSVLYAKDEAGKNELHKIDIFKLDFSLSISNIKAKIISDVEIIGKMFEGPNEMRRCGIAFEDLSEKQMSQLDTLIQNLAAA